MWPVRYGAHNLPQDLEGADLSVGSRRLPEPVQDLPLPLTCAYLRGNSPGVGLEHTRWEIPEPPAAIRQNCHLTKRLPSRLWAGDAAVFIRRTKRLVYFASAAAVLREAGSLIIGVSFPISR